MPFFIGLIAVNDIDTIGEMKYQHMPFASLDFKVCGCPHPGIEVDNGVYAVLPFKQYTGVQTFEFIDALIDGHLSVFPPEGQEWNPFDIVESISFRPWNLFDRVSAPFAETGVVINDVITDNAFHNVLWGWLYYSIEILNR